jgi:hypothetical protein
MPDEMHPLESVEDTTAVISNDLRGAAPQVTPDASDGRAQAQERPRRTVLVAAALALLGAGAFGAGVAAVFVTDNEIGAAALFVAGTALIVLGCFGHRLKAFRYKDLDFELYEEAHARARRGDVEGARVLTKAADVVSGRAAQIADSYASLRASMSAGKERESEMTKIYNRAVDEADSLEIDREDVLRRLWCGSEGQRVWALGVLRSRPQLATTRAVLEAIQRPDDMFDLYHALFLANTMLHLEQTQMWHQERIQEAVRELKEHDAFGTDSHCVAVADDILAHVPRRHARTASGAGT